MRNAILHIGTEKTGSTAVQNFLYKNEKLLNKHGVLFPYKDCGFISNHRLVSFALSVPDPSLIKMTLKAFPQKTSLTNSTVNHCWKNEFVTEHSNLVRDFQAQHKNSTVVYSSEHFHSRVHNENDLHDLKVFLNSLYDNVSIVVYLRRQDRLAISAYNTAIQGGAKSTFVFNSDEGKLPYYDYAALAHRWMNVFGKEQVALNIYEPRFLKGRDVAKDFMHSAILKGNHLNIRNLQNKLVFDKSNERLSYTALGTLLEFNNTATDDEILKGLNKHAIRQELIKQLHQLKDDFGELLPSRSSAQMFYNLYKSDNDALGSDWANGSGFNDDFSMYPVQKSDLPVVDTKTLLTNLLDQHFRKIAA